MLKDIDLW